MKSFLQGKRLLNVTALRSPHTGVPTAGTPGPLAPAGPAPHVDIVKQGDKIIRMVITCTCGERTEIECLYPPGQ